ncbi:alcohol dehydrogenase [Geodermatophilus sp. Leaf369]|uniref:NAD(P)-dependent alcohol dehydrogenase n=1 Tax=Geodermatophilus sp. Leaf369 TaxID=1736354 RepID=UPI0006FA37E4|nr:NAD(P)-dependent alcohol dehydrogenase [Geodermatophilus sp. Leaf369]KQS58415.1 alcohol dehydrogenase [Geodermatophilus sp. Leaf369]QNG36762.1 NAD(P)-dependent alcohol dehydrogenase [Geodermatophilaceae bacterium NBWT11]
MPTTVTARSTASAHGSFERTTIERRDVRPNDVRIEIAFAGICHSDIHTARDEWGAANYPLVPGHEIAGTVAEVGAEVTKYKVGDRVGVGCFIDSCRECENCKAGEEQYCLKGETGTYGGMQDGKPTDGGYSEQIVVDENYVLGIPEGISLEQAAPLLCAGITLYSPLKHWGAGPGKKVAIVGLGGLGHMGVKIAAALGAEVTVLSQSLKKQEDGLRFGAEHYYATSEPETFEKLAGQFDLIVNTVSATLDLDAYLGMLRVNGTLVEVGAPEQPMTEAAFSLITNRRSLAGSKIGGIRETQEMLDFCAEHHLGAEVEVIGGDEIDEAYERVVGSDVRYRFVIDTARL